MKPSIMNFPNRATIVEVAPRDGLQNEKKLLNVADKVEFIRLLDASGLKVIEAASFVSPKHIPQMADSHDVVKKLNKEGPTRYPVLVPNTTGYVHAKAAEANSVAIIASASETFSHKNSNCTIEQGINRCLEILSLAKNDGTQTRAYISCALGCPYEGTIPLSRVVKVAKQLHTGGCSEIVIADTIGKATPLMVHTLITELLHHIPVSDIGIHLHDTYGQALANIYSALQLGITIIDSSVAGLGGCPFAQGATGNVATEDLLYMLNGLNIVTGVDLDALTAAGQFICNKLGRHNGSKVSNACRIR